LHLYGFFVILDFGLVPAGRIYGHFSNNFRSLFEKRSWVIYGGITQLPHSSKAQGRFAKSCPSIRETPIVLQEDWTAAVCDRPAIYETWTNWGFKELPRRWCVASAVLVAIT